jgi:hypothetical protein
MCKQAFWQISEVGFSQQILLGNDESDEANMQIGFTYTHT